MGPAVSILYFTPTTSMQLMHLEALDKTYASMIIYPPIHISCETRNVFSSLRHVLLQSLNAGLRYERV